MKRNPVLAQALRALRIVGSIITRCGSQVVANTNVDEFLSQLTH